MGVAVLAITVGGAVAVFMIWLILLETSIRVEPGTLALLLRRGKATGRAVGPGRHFVVPGSRLTMQVYPSRELVILGGGSGTGDPRVEFVDEPLAVLLADRTAATVSYTLRCQLEPGRLKSVHNSFGPEGIWAALRDTARAALIGVLEQATIADVPERAALERRCENAIGSALDGVGFKLRGFTLRQLDLGETGLVIQAAARTAAELEREEVLAELRQARIANDVAMLDVLGDADVDLLLRYRRLESWNDLLVRWNGNQPIPPLLSMPLSASATADERDGWRGEDDDEYLAHDALTLDETGSSSMPGDAS